MLNKFYWWTKVLATILLISVDLYGILTTHPTGYALLRGMATGACMYHIWFRGTFDEKQNSLSEEMVGKEQKTN